MRWSKKTLILNLIFFGLFSNTLFFQNCAPAQRYGFSVTESSHSQGSGEPSADLSSYQWYLKNSGRLGGVIGQDINVEKVWSNKIYGKSITIAVVDEGVQLSHSDLSTNASNLSWNFADPSMGSDTSLPGGSHGTSVAGIIAAADNGYGVIGIAPLSKLIAFNITGYKEDYKIGALSGTVKGVSYISQIDISNSSWGPPDGTGGYSKGETLWGQAIETGLTKGRGGLGTIYIWAAGNGAFESADRSNYDGYAGYHGVVSVCAVDDRGQQAEYSEPGSNLWVCGYGGGYTGAQLATTDVEGAEGYNPSNDKIPDFTDFSYTKKFMGTSASAPVVTGVVSLILEKAKLIGKSLSWRDVKWILAQSAKAPSHVAISKNGYGLRVYDGYGFGIIDANAAVDLVSTWTPVGSAVSAVLPSGTGLITVASSIPNGFNIDDDGLTSSLVISSNANSTKISKIEYIDLNINLSHPNWGELVIQLQHSGTHPTTGAYVTTDIITEEHICKKIDPESENSTVMDCSELDNNSSSNYAFRFGVSRHLGESPVGTWTLKIYDSENNLKSGTLTSWGLKVYGE